MEVKYYLPIKQPIFFRMKKKDESIDFFFNGHKVGRFKKKKIVSVLDFISSLKLMSFPYIALVYLMLSGISQRQKYSYLKLSYWNI